MLSISSSPACPKRMASICVGLSRCLPSAWVLSTFAHSSNTEFCIPNPKLRMATFSNVSSHFWSHSVKMRSMIFLFSSKRSCSNCARMLSNCSLGSSAMRHVHGAVLPRGYAASVVCFMSCSGALLSLIATFRWGSLFLYDIWPLASS